MSYIEPKPSAKFPFLHRSKTVNRPQFLRGVSKFDVTLAKTNTGDKPKL